MNPRFQVFYEATPNPHSMKFYVTEKITDETACFEDPTKAARSPLAEKIFGFPWAQAVLIGPNFVTITKQSWVDWTVLAEPLANLLAEHLNNDEGIFLPEPEWAEPELSFDESPVVQKIKEILNSEIRPAVAMDGGDIAFHSYKDNRLYLHMKGACSGCPSAMHTLKNGVEERLKQDIPDLIEVISV